MRFYRISKKTYFFYFIILLLCLSWSSPALACYCRDKTISLQANMHNLQTIIETYAVDYGVYPKDMKVLEKEAKAQVYWKDFENPYTNEAGYRRSFGEMIDWEKPANERLSTVKYLFGLRVRAEEYPEIEKNREKLIGRVLYDYKSPRLYSIYSVDGDGKLLIKYGKVFYLSNA